MVAHARTPHNRARFPSELYQCRLERLSCRHADYATDGCAAGEFYFFYGRVLDWSCDDFGDIGSADEGRDEGPRSSGEEARSLLGCRCCVGAEDPIQRSGGGASFLIQCDK